MTQNHLKYFWKVLRVTAVLAIAGAIVAFSGEYAFATPCLPGQPCPQITPKWRREGPNPSAFPQEPTADKQGLPTSNKAATAGKSKITPKWRREGPNPSAFPQEPTADKQGLPTSNKAATAGKFTSKTEAF
jgi:hypothetical protein